MSAAEGRSGTCPSCGAALNFAVGSSHAAVCRFCNALVARQNPDASRAIEGRDGLTPTLKAVVIPLSATGGRRLA